MNTKKILIIGAAVLLVILMIALTIGPGLSNGVSTKSTRRSTDSWLKWGTIVGLWNPDIPQKDVPIGNLPIN
jgi:hypothetical protein